MHVVLLAPRRQQRGLVDEVARSAPDEPRRRRCELRRDRRPAASGTLRVWTLRIASRPVLSGQVARRRADRSDPGAAAPCRGRRVDWSPPSTMTPSRLEKPSISVRIWFSVCSCSLEPPIAICPRARPIASSSSMKMIAGACSRACLNRSRTRAAPTPTIISTNSAALIEKNGTPASPATALASSVFPGARRADQQHALGRGAAETRVLLGLLEEVDDLDELVLGFVDAGHVVEGDLRVAAPGRSGALCSCRCPSSPPPKPPCARHAGTSRRRSR